MKRYFKHASWLAVMVLAWGFQSCSDDGTYEIPDATSGLQNDLIKRSLGPNVVGGVIEFAYAMAQLPTEGKIVEASVEASIGGATGTVLQNKSFNTGGSVEIGSPSTTDGKLTKVTFTKDTSAATLRYNYVIPEEARGKSLTFKFLAKSSNGQVVTYDAGPYEISSMDMVLDLVAKDPSAAYISIADLKLYTAAEAAASPSKVDLVYLYRATPASFGHALVAPATDPMYLPGVTLPTGVSNNTKLIKAFTVRDQQLARLQYGVYVDDIDLKTKDFSTAPNFITDLRAEYGAWVETADGTYRALVFVNAVTNTPAVKEIRISIKRLKVK